jgi:TetR/AcrR family transcriptional regulator, tetracycline repressor protein
MGTEGMARDTPLTEDEVVDAALRLIEADGVGRFSMRKLADELSVTPMAIYYHVRRKEELLGLVENRVIDQIGWQDHGSWTERLLFVATRAWEVLTQYPGLASYLLDRPMSEHAKLGVARVGELLIEAGFDEGTAELVLQSYHVYSYGLIAMDTHFRSHRTAAARRQAVVFGFQTWLYGLEVQLASTSPSAETSPARTPVRQWSARR